MNVKHKLAFLALICSSLSCSLAVHASPLPKDVEKVERVLVGSDTADDNKERALAADVDSSKEEQEKILTKPLFETTHPAAFYSLYNVLPYNNMVELHDRSLWDICPGYSLLGWLPGDYVTISPSSFGDYRYCLTNQRRSEFVYVNINLGPDRNSDYHMKINSIFIDGRGMLHVIVKDGLGNKSDWLMSGYEYAKVSRWKKGQTVMVGLNTDVTAEGNNVLINVNFNNWASGSCIRY